MDKSQKVLGLILSRQRQAKRLSQERLAELAGVHRTYISQIERGLKSPTLVTLMRISAALGTTTSRLISELEKESDRLSRQSRLRH